MVLCAGAFGCYAAQGSLPGAQGQGYDLNLSYSRTTLKAVADAITQQVGIAFSYETALAGYPMENLEVSEKGATIEAILAAVFTPRGIDYRVVDKVVVLTRSTRPVPAASAAAKSEVKGVVRDAAGNPMIGVTVTIKGTLVGVSTGVDGGYAIPADGNATLLFSYIGYRPHEEVVGRRTQIDVTMQEDELVMDEVVVVGYGTLKKRNIVGAVENLSGDAVENRPNANITRSLQGQIPGLNIVQVDGKADHAGEVTIRGVNNTFKARVSGGEKTNKLGQGGGALVLIDGAEGDMGSVNPDDIASISVLKDASSAAVYGARGAFGVILITTKDPEKGKVRVSYNGSVSLHRRTVIWEDNVVTDPVQWVDAFRESYLNSSPTATVPSLFNNYMPYSNAWFEELKRRRADPTMDNYDIDANGNYNYYGETNWLKEIYKSVNYSTTHAVSIQGGREGVSYYISGRYYNQDGIYKVGEETYKKYNLRAKGSIRIRPWLTLDNNTSLMSSKYHQPMVHYGQQVISRQIDMFAFPFALLKNPDGTWTQTAAKTGYAAFAEGTSWQENNKLEVANTTTFNFEFVPDVFKVSADVTYKGSRWSRDRMENLYTYYTGVNVSGQDNSFSSLENWTYRSDYISTNIVGTVTPKLGSDHDLNVVAGWNLEDYDYRTQKTYRQGNLYPSKPSFTLMDGEYYSTTSGGYTWGLVGFFGRVNYAYAGRYLAEVSARYDGSSKFPSSSQWGFFPSASVGWRLSEEPWLKPHVEGWLDNFKVRASIGSLGNANIDPYQYLETMTASGSASIAKSSVIINGQNVPYTSVPSLIPDDITWEKVTTYNIGLDLDLFHNRLSFTGDYYRRNTTDLYTVGPNLPQVLGSAAPYGNYASLKTKGWELSLSWRDSFNLGGKPFSYSIKGMLWDSRSWITDYYNETGDLTTYYKGMEIGEIWGFRTAGIYASNADALNGPAYNFFKNGEMFRAYAGDLRFVDVDGDGIMTKGNRTLSNHGDLEIIGNQSPRYQYSINMSLNWNGIGLSIDRGLHHRGRNSRHGVAQPERSHHRAVVVASVQRDRPGRVARAVDDARDTGHIARHARRRHVAHRAVVPAAAHLPVIQAADDAARARLASGIRRDGHGYEAGHAGERIVRLCDDARITPRIGVGAVFELDAARPVIGRAVLRPENHIRDRPLGIGEEPGITPVGRYVDIVDTVAVAVERPREILDRRPRDIPHVDVGLEVDDGTAVVVGALLREVHHVFIGGDPQPEEKLGRGSDAVPRKGHFLPFEQVFDEDAPVRTGDRRLQPAVHLRTAGDQEIHRLGLHQRHFADLHRKDVRHRGILADGHRTRPGIDHGLRYGQVPLHTVGVDRFERDFRNGLRSLLADRERQHRSQRLEVQAEAALGGCGIGRIGIHRQGSARLVGTDRKYAVDGLEIGRHFAACVRGQREGHRMELDTVAGVVGFVHIRHPLVADDDLVAFLP